MNQQKILRITGLAGILAALTGFIAEMLLYGGFYSGSEFYGASRRIMSEISINRLMVGGVLGPIEAIIYIIGFWHVYLALKPGSKLLSQITFAGFSSMMIVGGAFHSAFVYTGLIQRAKNTVQSTDLQIMETLLDQSGDYIHLLYKITFFAGLMGTIALVSAILFRKTLYPKWILFFTPTLLVLAVPPAARLIPAPLGGIIYGGSVSLSFLLFFCVSEIMLWNKLSKDIK